MSDGIVIRAVAPADLEALRPLWEALYRHQAGHGMLLRLPPDAFDLWVRAWRPQLGRFATAIVAERDGHLLGFAAGRLRTLPPHFGAEVVGTLSELFVGEAARGAGIGQRLVAALVEWFATQGITRIEVQVVSRNPAASRFYERLGWSPELSQLVWRRPIEE
ncbi:MAG TPA: GNAT family N-acetyltransferase [Vicinamibacterales bacterium]|nr:GNAT family N-acetyltransferase [Vicinamibacterales bacterium]